MPRGTKQSRTKVKTGVTTGTAVAFLFLTASAAFAAAAFTRLDVKLGIVKPANAPAKPATPAFGDAAKKIPASRLPGANTQTSSLAMELDGDTPRLNIIVAGTTNVPMLKARFTALGEAFTVKKLRIFNNDASNDTGINQIKLTYALATGATETKTAVLTNGVADVQDLNFVVQPNIAATLSVSADLAEITTTDVSGDSPQLGIDFDTNFEAVGMNSGMQLASIGFDNVLGNQMVIHKTKPTVTLASNSPSGAGVPSMSEVLRFTVAADRKADLVLNQLGFKINATDNASTDWNTGRKLTADKFSLFDTTNPSERLDCTWSEYGTPGFIEPGVTEDVGYVVCLFNQQKTIAAGASKTYFLKMDTTEASAAMHDSVRIDIPDSQTGTAVISISWGETGAGAMPYIDATGVRNLPITGNVIRY